MEDPVAALSRRLEDHIAETAIQRRTVNIQLEAMERTITDLQTDVGVAVDWVRGVKDNVQKLVEATEGRHTELLDTLSAWRTASETVKGVSALASVGKTIAIISAAIGGVWAGFAAWGGKFATYFGWIK